MPRSAEALDPATVARVVEPSVVRVYAKDPIGTSGGTGFVVTHDGRIVTNHHVIARVVEHGGSVAVLAGRAETADRYPAVIVAFWPEVDLALLEAPGLAAPPLSFALPGGLDVGDRVFSMGFPGVGDRLGPEGVASFAQGTVGRTFGGRWIEDGGDLTIIQHSAAINRGDSGGPLLDACGHIVGVNTQREVRAIQGPMGIPLVSDPVQAIFFSSDAGSLLDRLAEQGITYRLAHRHCSQEAVGLVDTTTAVLVVGLALALLVWDHGPTAPAIRRAPRTRDPVDHLPLDRSGVAAVEKRRPSRAARPRRVEAVRRPPSPLRGRPGRVPAGRWRPYR